MLGGMLTRCARHVRMPKNEASMWRMPGYGEHLERMTPACDAVRMMPGHLPALPARFADELVERDVAAWV